VAVIALLALLGCDAQPENPALGVWRNTDLIKLGPVGALIISPRDWQYTLTPDHVQIEGLSTGKKIIKAVERYAITGNTVTVTLADGETLLVKLGDANHAVFAVPDEYRFERIESEVAAKL
jgi:hypothetical protein